MPLKYNGLTVPYSGYVNFRYQPLISLSHRSIRIWRKTYDGRTVIFRGSYVLTDSGTFTHPELLSGSEVSVSAKITFSETVEDKPKDYIEYYMYDEILPTRVYDLNAYVEFDIYNNALRVNFHSATSTDKSSAVDYVPESVEITEVRVKL